MIRAGDAPSIAIKNGREPFLTSRSADPQGGSQGWRAINGGRGGELGRIVVKVAQLTGLD